MKKMTIPAIYNPIHAFITSYILIPLLMSILVISGCGGRNNGDRSQEETELVNLRETLTKPNLFKPVIDARVDLYVATTSGKPSNLFTVKSGNTFGLIDLPPIDLPKLDPYYTKAPHGIFIDKYGDRVRWFSYSLNNATGAVKAVWQVSKSPFPPKGGVNWKTPPGLVKSGELPALAGEFSIDFGNLYPIIFLPPGTASIKPIPQKQLPYYVRVVAVDGSGNLIGDPGEGLSVVYGQRIPDRNNPVNNTAVASFELWTPVTLMGIVVEGADDLPQHLGEASVSPIGAPNLYTGNPPDATGFVQCSTRLFSLMNINSEAFRVIIQVSEYPFSSSSTWPDTKNIIYEKSYDLPINLSALQFPSTSTHMSASDLSSRGFLNSVLIPFDEFGKVWGDMTKDTYIYYYVRAITLKRSYASGVINAASAVDVAYSDTVKIKYGYGPGLTINWEPKPLTPPGQKIGASIPGVRIKSYTTVQWGSPESMHRYYVYRMPAAAEIQCRFKNDKGEILYPYADGLLNGAYKNVSAADYQNNLIPYFLSPGTTVYIPPPVTEADKEWWEELIDGVTGFFSDLATIFQTVYNQVQTAYNGVKQGFIDFVVDLCPVPELKTAFRAAIESAVNGVLLAAGLPPTLPNFDQLIDGNIEYLAGVALSEAGVPAAELAGAVVADIVIEMKNQVASAANHSDPNPIGAPFLKLNPDYMYRPAYIEVEVYNDSDYPSAPGSFNLNVTFEFGYYDTFSTSYDPVAISLMADTGYSWSPAIADDYLKHFYYGLNGYTLDVLNGQKADRPIYDVFEPVTGWKIPMLKPHDTKVFRIYLKEYGGGQSRYPDAEAPNYQDFTNMYKFNGNKGLTYFNLDCSFVTPQEYLGRQDLFFIPAVKDAVPVYDYISSEAGGRYNKPVNEMWSN